MAPATRTLGWSALGAVAATGGLALYAAWSQRRIEAAVPADGTYLHVDGARLHYVDRGEGPPIVMIHGLGGQLRNFSYALVDLLAADHRVILIDRPGSGYSTPAPGTRPGIADQAVLVAKAIAALGLDRPLLVGHSLGGAIALAVALDHPEAVRGIALIAPLTRPQAEVPQAFRALAIASTGLRRAAAWTLATPLGQLTSAQTARLVFAPEDVPEDFAIRGGGALALRPGNVETASFELVAANTDVEQMVPRYPSLRVPTAILFGRDDQVLDATVHGETSAAEIPDAAFTLIRGGHMLPVTKPEATAGFIRDAFARTG